MGLTDRRGRARRGLASIGVTAIAAGAMCAGAGARRAPAQAARTLRAHDSAKLHYVSASGSTLYEIGSASGSLPGSMRVHMRIEARFSGSFVIYAHGGIILGHGSAVPHGSGAYESFAGTLWVTGGTGRFRHARGRAGLYGVFDRRSYALTVQTTGTLRY